MANPPTGGSPFDFQANPDAVEGVDYIDGYHTIRAFDIMDGQLLNFFKLEKALRNLLRCSNYFPCLHAGRLNGKRASDLQLTVSADSTDGIDSPNLVAGTNITIAVSGSDITISAGGSGDISSGSNLTGGRVVHATGNKQIDTPIDLRLGYVTTDSADDTVQLLAGSGKRIEISSPDKICFDVNGTNEMIVESGKVTIPGLLDPTGVVCTEQASSPHSTAAGEGTFYVRNTAPSSPAFERDDGTDTLLITGSTGSTDNAILRADGTGGSTVQSSGIIINDNNQLVLAGNKRQKASRLTQDTTLDDTYHVLFCDNDDGNWQFVSPDTVTLPASPGQGQEYLLKNVGASANIVVARNGKNINGAASDYTLTPGSSVRLIYDSTEGWHTF